MTEQFEEPAELSPPYVTDIGAYADNLKASTHGPPLPERGQGTAPPARNADLSGIGVDITGRGHASTPILSVLGSATPNKVNGGVSPKAMVDGAHLSGIPTDRRPIMSHDNNIVVFYQHTKSKIIHIRIQAAGDRLQVIDRPAVLADRERYPRQWAHFANNDDQTKKGPGTPLTALFKQQPSIVRGLEAESIPTVEHLANLGDVGIEAIAPLGGAELVQRANQFIEQQPVRDRDAKIAEQAKEIEGLQGQVGELTAQANRKRRMPKTDEAPEDK